MNTLKFSDSSGKKLNASSVYDDLFEKTQDEINVDMSANIQKVGNKIKDQLRLESFTDGIKWSTGNYFINATNGARVRGTNAIASAFVDITGMTLLAYMRPIVSGTTEPLSGIAFYTDANESSFIAGSGVSSDYANIENGSGYLYTVKVPSTAKYVRFSWWNNETAKASFKAYDATNYQSLENITGYIDLNALLADKATIESGIIASTGKIYKPNQSANSFQLANAGYSGITVTAGNRYTYVAFLQESMSGLSANTRVVLSQNEPARIKVEANTSKTLDVPDDCNYIVITKNGQNDDLTPIGGCVYKRNSTLYIANKGEPVPSLSILFVGNSLALDSVSYVPAILSSLGVKANLTIGILYCGGRTLRLHYRHFINNERKYVLYESYNMSPWESRLSDATGLEIIKYRKWDIISFQQGSFRSGDYSTYQPYLTNLIEFICTNVDYKWKMAWNNIHSNTYNNEGAYKPEDVFDPTIPEADDVDVTSKGTNVTAAQAHAKTESNYSEQMAALELLLAENPIEIVFPVATATQNARNTILNNINYRFAEMTYDGKHAQEGIACQVEGYTIAIKIMELLGIHNKSIINDNTVVDTAFENYWNIPGQHGSPIGSGVDDIANRKIAQKCAIMACVRPTQKSNILVP